MMENRKTIMDLIWMEFLSLTYNMNDVRLKLLFPKDHIQKLT